MNYLTQWLAVSSLTLLPLLMVSCFGSGGGTTTPPTECQSGESTRAVTVQGQSRSYILYSPSCSLQTSPLPLMIMFHGFSSDAATQIAFTGLEATAEKHGFFLIFAESGVLGGGVKGWQLTKSGNIDLDYTDAVIADVSSHYKVNASKVYAVGHSNGAQLIYRLAELRPNTFAAVASFGGCSFNNVVLNNTGGVVLPTSRYVPMAFVLGTSNEVITPSISLDASFTEPAVRNGARDVLRANYNCGATTNFGSYTIYSGCNGGAEILWYAVPGMTHMQWASPLSSQYPTPAPPVDANELLWSFFQKF